MKVWQVVFPPCLMHGPRREKRSGQKSTCGLENNIPFSQALKVHPQNLSGRQRQGPAGAGAGARCRTEALQPLCPSPRGWQRPGWGYGGTPCFPQRCLSRQRAGPPPAPFPAHRGQNPCAPSPPSASRPAHAARWHSHARRAESAPGPDTDPPLLPLPPVSMGFHGERASAGCRDPLGHGRALWGPLRHLTWSWHHPKCCMGGVTIALARYVVPRFAGAWCRAGEQL